MCEHDTLTSILLLELVYDQSNLRSPKLTKTSLMCIYPFLTTSSPLKSTVLKRIYKFNKNAFFFLQSNATKATT